jgi:uncharacterized protein
VTDRVAAERSAFHVIAKPAGPICNLDCRYCFYLEKARLYPATTIWAMSARVLETFVRDYIASQDAPVVSFAWQGGEPTLLGLPFFEKVVALQQQYAAGKRIENGFQTNGVLIDDRWCEFLARHKFLVGLSIDGPQPLHDRYRVDRGGHPTFDRVMEAGERLRQHQVAFNTLTAVHRENARKPLDVYRFLRDAGSEFMQFIPIVERAAADDSGGLAAPGITGTGRVTKWSVEPTDYGRFLCDIFDEWVMRDVGRVFVQLFDVALESWTSGQASLCVFSPTCGRALAIEHNGDLYACDHYVLPEFRLGNIVETPVGALVESAAQMAFGEAKRNALPACCRRCEVLFACHGECPKNRFVPSPEDEPGLNYLCAAYKRFFTHVDPAMRFMANQLRHERAPRNVMAWMRERALQQAGRNDPCPCGSGKKFKRCCGDIFHGREDGR